MENKIIRRYSQDDEPILSEEEQEILVNWTIDNHHLFSKSGDNRCRQHLNFFDEVPQAFWDIKQRIIEKENLHGYEQEPLFTDSIAYMTDGGKLQLHTDPRHDGKEHVRFNVYIQLPYRGGLPIYAGKKYEIQERRYICCRASIDRHEGTTVHGDRARIIVSYGFLLPREDIGKVEYNFPYSDPNDKY